MDEGRSDQISSKGQQLSVGWQQTAEDTEDDNFRKKLSQDKARR